jgi:hypothetical protein
MAVDAGANIASVRPAITSVMPRSSLVEDGRDLDVGLLGASRPEMVTVPDPVDAKFRTSGRLLA